MSLAGLRAERLDKLRRLREAGVDPYGSRSSLTGPIARVRALCPEPEAEAPAPAGGGGPASGPAPAPAPVTVAGRVVALRDMGKSCWLDLRDQTGHIQANLVQKRLPDTFGQAKLLDVGDFLEVTGDLSRSRVGEITVFATGFRFLCKSLEPLPAKWQGLRDTEIRFRRRYLDLIANGASRERFLLRSRIFSFVRRWLDERAFVEVETPVLQRIYGGAAARPFKTRHHALGTDLYLRISPETWLKRLLVGGFDRVYEIARNFRNEGIDASHLPEFTMMEVYQAYGDFTDMMDLAENLVADCARALLGTTVVRVGGQEADLAPPWPRASVHELVAREGGVDPEDGPAMLRRLEGDRLLAPDQAAALSSALAAGGEAAARARDGLLKECMDELVEPRIVRPTFATHQPASFNPLCKRTAGQPRLSDRFEVIAAGFELANAFSELNDPAEQRERFEAQINPANEEAYCEAVDEDYVSALEVGLPPAGGMGIGMDRLVMLLSGQPSIREVVLFPTLRPKGQAEVMEEMERAEADG